MGVHDNSKMQLQNVIAEDQVCRWRTYVSFDRVWLWFNLLSKEGG